MNWEVLDLSILGPALLAGLVVVSTHVPLGQQVLARGIIFVDLAVAQMAGLGVIVAATIDGETGGFVVQVSAAGAALVAALILNWLQDRRPEVQEAQIGVMFVLAASASILVLAGNPHAGDHLKDLLVGQILWVLSATLMPGALVSAAVLALWFMLGRRGGNLWFYGLLAVTVTVSVQLVGVYLVFATLIVPGLATRRLAGVRRLIWGYAIGTFGYAGGLVVSTLSDLPTGAVIVWTLALTGMAAGLILRRAAQPHGM